MPARLVEISAREGQLPQTREEMHRIAPPHPFTGGGVLYESVHAREVVSGEGKITLYQRDVAQVQVGIREGLVIAPVATALGSALVQLAGAIEITTLHMEPPERIEVARRVVLVADPLGQGQPFLEDRQRAIVRTLPREVDA